MSSLSTNVLVCLKHPTRLRFKKWNVFTLYKWSETFCKRSTLSKMSKNVKHVRYNMSLLSYKCPSSSSFPKCSRLKKCLDFLQASPRFQKTRKRRPRFQTNYKRPQCCRMSSLPKQMSLYVPHKFQKLNFFKYPDFVKKHPHNPKCLHLQQTFPKRPRFKKK